MNETKILYDPSTPITNSQILKDIESALKIGGKPFRRLRTTSTATYITEDKTIRVVPKNTNLSGHDTHFISMVKKHFKSLPLPAQISSDRPFYEYFRPISIYSEIDNVKEIDLNSAYWQTALNLGYIDDEFYKKAYSRNVSKKARLIAIGTLGKKTIETNFEPPFKSSPIHSESYEPTRVFWDNIVYTVGETMRDVVKMYKPHVFGMWFDAIFVSESVSESIRSALKRKGFEVKTKKIESYIVSPKDNIIPGAVVTRIYKNGEKKEMQINYLKEEDKKLTMKQFLIKVANSPYL